MKYDRSKGRRLVDSSGMSNMFGMATQYTNLYLAGSQKLEGRSSIRMTEITMNDPLLS